MGRRDKRDRRAKRRIHHNPMARGERVKATAKRLGLDAIEHAITEEAKDEQQATT